MINVGSAYRRQEFLRDICRKLDYQGRFVWLVSATDVPVLGSKQLGISRLRFRLLNITEEPYSFHRFTPSDNRKIKLDQNTALTVLPMLRGRRRDLFIFLHPTRMRKWSLANSDKLSPEEVAVLQKKDTFDLGTTSVAHAICVYRGLVDPRGRLTEQGARLLAAKKGR